MLAIKIVARSRLVKAWCKINKHILDSNLIMHTYVHNRDILFSRTKQN